MRFKAALTPIGFGSTISLGDSELDRVRSVEVVAAAGEGTTVTITAIGIDAIVEGDATGVYVIDAISSKRYRLEEVDEARFETNDWVEVRVGNPLIADGHVTLPLTGTFTGTFYAFRDALLYSAHKYYPRLL